MDLGGSQMSLTEILREWRGVKVIIYPPTWIHESVVIGENTKISAFVDIDKDVDIGEGNNIQPMSTISKGTKIGKGNFIGPDFHTYNDEYMNSVINPPLIGNFNRFGGSVIINPGINVGDNCIICSGAMITKDLPDGTKVLPKKTKKERVVW